MLRANNAVGEVAEAADVREPSSAEPVQKWMAQVAVSRFVTELESCTQTETAMSTKRKDQHRKC